MSFFSFCPDSTILVCLKGARKMEITISRHARERMKERLGIKSDKEAEKAAKSAWERGRVITDFEGLNECHLQGEDQYDGQLTVLVSRNALFLFNEDGELVTVILMNEFMGKAYRKNFRSHRQHTEEEDWLQDCPASFCSRERACFGY